jgi:hypothetical protein
MKKSVLAMIESMGLSLEAWEFFLLAFALFGLVGFGVFKVLVWALVK